MTVLIVVSVITILISFLCSLYEAILYSTRMSTLEVEKSEGKMKSKAQKMISMKNRISMPISAILILNTVAHTAGATLAGMYAAKALGDTMVPLFSVVFTIAVLFLSEILPKTIGAVYWRSLWPTIVWPLTIMKYALYPFIILTQKFSESLTDSGNTAPHVTEAEILGTIRMGARDGQISQWESLMLHNIIRLENKAVEEIMTPRTVMFTLNEEMELEKAFRLANEKGFSRIPVYRGDRENIVGYIMLNDLISARMLNEPGTRISSILKPIMFVREDQNCLVLLTSFLKKRLHIAMIGDDYGGVAGLVTLEDLIETILGAEIVDETDDVVDLQKLARKRMQKRFYLEKEMEGSETDRESFGTENLAKQDALMKKEKGKEEPVAQIASDDRKDTKTDRIDWESAQQREEGSREHEPDEHPKKEHEAQSPDS